MNFAGLKKEIENIDFIDWSEIKGKTLFITGATGLVGFSIIKNLLAADHDMNLGIKIYALVRNMDRAKERFADFEGISALELVLGDMENIPVIAEPIDFIIHGASVTASKEMVNHAVETINTSVKGTENILQLAKEKNVKSIVYLSSMEMYGHPEKGHKVKESDTGELSPLDIRNSYPIGKLICESMCCAYSSEYGVPAKIVRLTQTYGEDVNYSDGRIFAYFNKCAAEKKNIVLKTKGETERSYLEVFDAVTAILAVMLKGENGMAYNAADETSYCSIAQMAEAVAERAGIKVEYDIQDAAVNGFPQPVYMDLDTTKLKELGWKPLKQPLVTRK